MAIHVVQTGDTLFTIAKRYGISIHKLKRNNPQIKNTDMIYPGDEINIPAPGEEIHTPTPRDEPSILEPGEKTPASSGETSPFGYEEIQSQPQDHYSIYQLAMKYPYTFFLKGSAGTNRIALTFDDGPDGKYTPQILDVLKEYNVRATFFLLGSYAEKYPQIVQRIINEGHVIGNHSWSHADLRTLSQQRLMEEVMQTENFLYEIVGLRTALIRPPYGAVTNFIIEQLKNLDYRIINWSVDSEDWRANNPTQIINNSLLDVTAEAILLFHSAGGKSIAVTVEVLPRLLKILWEKGYVFVTVDELLDVPAYK